MISHSNALGLELPLPLGIFDGKPRVLEHWPGDGEHFHICFDFKAPTSWATDVLGRELEIRYSEDLRVTARRDIGGERYAIASTKPSESLVE